MRLLLVSLLACILFSGQLFAQEKKDQKATSDSKSVVSDVPYQVITTQKLNRIVDSLTVLKAVYKDVGYGFQKTDNITSSISSVNVAAMKRTSYSNLAEYLMGRVPGVTVSRDPSNPFGYTIHIRGINSFTAGTQPLIVIDGTPINSMDALATVDPQDISSVDIIKDGSAAIYGSRGANGVILINTKH